MPSFKEDCYLEHIKVAFSPQIEVLLHTAKMMAQAILSEKRFSVNIDVNITTHSNKLGLLHIRFIHQRVLLIQKF